MSALTLRSFFWTRPRKSLELYPYSRSLGTRESEGVKWWAVTLIVVAFGILGGYLYWLMVAFASPSKPDRYAIDDVSTGSLAAVAESVGRGDVMPVAARSLIDDLPVGVVPFGSVVVDFQASEGSGAVDFQERDYLSYDDLAGRAGRAAALPVVDSGELVHQIVYYVSYWPDDSDLWCAEYDQDAQVCLSPVTSGAAWREVVGLAAACPSEWYLRELAIPGRGRWRCLDTGSSAVCAGDICRVYLLQRDYVSGWSSGVRLY